MDSPIVEFSCTYHYKEWVEIVGLVLLGIVYPGVEYWFGKTRKTRAGSLLEFMLLPLLSRLGKHKQPQLLLTGHIEPEEEDSMLEGREFEKKFANDRGLLFIDVKSDLTIEAGASLDGRKMLEDLAASTKQGWLRNGIQFALSMFAPQVAATPAPEAAPTAPTPTAQV